MVGDVDSRSYYIVRVRARGGQGQPGPRTSTDDALSHRTHGSDDRSHQKAHTRVSLG